MSNDFEVREVRATANDYRPDTPDEADDRTQPPDIVDAEIVDPDAAITDESPDSGSDAPDRDRAAASARPEYAGAHTLPDAAADDVSADTPDITDTTARPTGRGAADTADDPSPVTGDRPAGPAGEQLAGTGERGPAAGADGPGPNAAAELAGDADLMHERWTAIQATFVDDPRGSVAAAADLTAEAIGTLVAAAQERERGLRGEWDRDGVDTEGLRQALRNYRGFLDHLVSL
jgi:hypothetical protein